MSKLLVLIAESKTMLDKESVVSPELWTEHMAAGEIKADEIMKHLGQLSNAELVAELGLSPTLAAKMSRMIYEFPNKSLGLPAIEAYTGVVFKALQYDSLSSEAKTVCDSDVRIVSSLYGLLRPTDIIKPYRLDFTSKAAPGDKPLNTFWKKDVTIQLVRTIKETGYTDLLCLLPGDAMKCIDWKVVKSFCKVWKVDFVEVCDGGKTKTPTANKLKTMRGTLLRQIVSQQIAHIDSLRNIATDTYFCTGTPVYSDHFQFIC